MYNELKDGVVLCQLMNTLFPGAIKRVHKSTFAAHQVRREKKKNPLEIFSFFFFFFGFFNKIFVFLVFPDGECWVCLEMSEENGHEGRRTV
jgi:hypothetical protein